MTKFYAMHFIMMFKSYKLKNKQVFLFCNPLSTAQLVKKIDFYNNIKKLYKNKFLYNFYRNFFIKIILFVVFSI